MVTTSGTGLKFLLLFPTFSFQYGSEDSPVWTALFIMLSWGRFWFINLKWNKAFIWKYNVTCLLLSTICHVLSLRSVFCLYLEIFCWKRITTKRGLDFCFLKKRFKLKLKENGSGHWLTQCTLVELHVFRRASWSAVLPHFIFRKNGNYATKLSTFILYKWHKLSSLYRSDDFWSQYDQEEEKEEEALHVGWGRGRRSWRGRG